MNIQDVLDRLKAESPVGRIIVGHAVIDDLLEQVLRGAMASGPIRNDPLFEGPTAPLGTVSAKELVCLRLGLIHEDLHSALFSIRKIRNAVAHNWTEAVWKSKEVQKHDAKLVALAQGKNLGGLFDDDSNVWPDAPPECFRATMFIAVVMNQLGKLIADKPRVRSTHMIQLGLA